MNSCPKYLYIIGNGFDLHHDILSSYRDFYDWMVKENPNILNEFEEVYGYCDDNWWSDFENNLASFNVIEYAQQIAFENPPDLLSDHCDRTWTDAQIEVEENLKRVYNRLRRCFHDWIVQLDSPNEAKRIKMQIDDAVFLTFNYTQTLESMYHVSPSEILHIHGCIFDDEDFVIGHGKSEEDLREENADDPEQEPEGLTDQESDDWRFEQAEKHPLHEQLAEDAAFAGIVSQKKPVREIIKRYENFFNSLSKVSKVYVYGKSFSEVDAPYFEEIAKRTCGAEWEFNDHEGENVSAIKNFVFKEKIKTYSIIDLNNILKK